MTGPSSFLLANWAMSDRLHMVGASDEDRNPNADRDRRNDGGYLLNEDAVADDLQPLPSRFSAEELKFLQSEFGFTDEELSILPGADDVPDEFPAPKI